MSDVILLGLEVILEEAGWDLPPRLYTIEGSEAEPKFAAMAEVEGHPCDVLSGMWHAGVRVPEAAIGLALIIEGERHLRINELRERAPERYAEILEVAAEDFAEDRIEAAVENAWLETCANFSPFMMPKNLTVHVRNSVAVLHTGWTLMAIRDQGGEPEALDPAPPKRLELSRVPHFMWQFLTGREPTD